MYFTLALFCTILFIVQFVISIIFSDIDIDGDADIDVDGGDTGGFSMSDLVSFKGLIHFFIGFSWTMWFCRESNQFLAACIAVGVGAIFVVVLALVYWGALKLKNEIRPEEGTDLIGREAEVYLKNSDGSYLVYTRINGSKRELKAYYEGEKEFQTGSIVRISSFNNGKYYIY